MKSRLHDAEQDALGWWHEGAGVAVAKGSLVIVRARQLCRNEVSQRRLRDTYPLPDGKRASECRCTASVLSYTVDGPFQECAIHVVKAAITNKTPDECELAAMAPARGTGITDKMA